MFKNSRNHKFIKMLSISVVSLGLLAGIGVASNNTNIHADDDPYGPAAIAKDDAEANAAGDQEGAKEDILNPDMRNIDEEGASWNSNDDIVKMSNEIFNSPNFVKGSKANQRKDQKFLHKYFKRNSDGTLSRVHHKARSRRSNIKKNKRNRRRVNRKHKRNYHYIHNHKKINLNKKRTNRKSKRQLKRNHIKLNKKQVNRLNKQLKKSKKLVKSKRAKHNRRYRNSLKRTIKNITRRLRLTRGNK